MNRQTGKGGLHTRRVIYASLTVAGMIAWRTVKARRERYRMLERGEIHSLQDLWLDVNGCRTYARHASAAGSDKLPVVLVHGWGISSSYFVPAAERLAAEFTVYAPDLPGHGKSATPAVPLDIPGLAHALLNWMDGAGIGRASLVGHSLGCQIVVEAALQRPDRIDRLILAGPTGDPAAKRMLEQLRRLMAGSLYERHSLSRHLVRDYLRMGARLWPELQAMMRDSIAEKLPRVGVPVLLIRGENDPIAPQQWLDHAAELVGTEHKVVIPRWGHAVQYSDPRAFTAAIRPFLS